MTVRPIELIQWTHRREGILQRPATGAIKIEVRAFKRSTYRRCPPWQPVGIGTGPVRSEEQVQSIRSHRRIEFVGRRIDLITEILRRGPVRPVSPTGVEVIPAETPGTIREEIQRESVGGDNRADVVGIGIDLCHRDGRAPAPFAQSAAKDVRFPVGTTASEVQQLPVTDQPRSNQINSLPSTRSLDVDRPSRLPAHLPRRRSSRCRTNILPVDGHQAGNTLWHQPQHQEQHDHDTGGPQSPRTPEPLACIHRPFTPDGHRYTTTVMIHLLRPEVPQSGTSSPPCCTSPSPAPRTAGHSRRLPESGPSSAGCSPWPRE